MARICHLAALVAVSPLVSSCGFWNPDPAERLAYRIEREARGLERDDAVSASFDFVPDAGRLRESPRFTGEATIRIAPDSASGAAGDSVIVVSEWFWTTYHNRFVRSPSAMTASKAPGEPFRITLRKSRDGIDWVGLR